MNVKKFIQSIFLCLFVVLFCFYCNDPANNNDDPGNGGGNNNPTNNPTPTITSVSPDVTVSHLPSFTLTVNGTNFVSGSTIVFNGKNKTTTYISASQLTCEIDPENTVVARSTQSFKTKSNVQVKVNNPAPGGGDSNAEGFTIHDNHQFDEPISLGKGEHPDIEVNTENNLVIVYQGERVNNGNHVYSTYSEDAGLSWSTKKNITTVKTNDPYDPMVSLAPDDSLNVIYGCPRSWYDGSVFFKRGAKKGTSWSSPSYLTDFNHTMFYWYTYSKTYDYNLDTDSEGNICCVFTVSLWESWDNDLYFTRSTNDGSTWTRSERISDSGTYPDIAIDSNQIIHMVWSERGFGSNFISQQTNEVFYKRSEDNGSTWTTEKNISNNHGYIGGLNLEIDGNNNLYLVYPWKTKNGNTIAVYFQRSEDGGSTWTKRKKISADFPSDSSNKCDLAIDSAGNLNVVWVENSKIYFSRSLNKGVKWSTPIRTFSVLDEPRFPAISVDSSGNIYLACFDYFYNSNNYTFDNDLYFCRSGN